MPLEMNTDYLFKSVPDLCFIGLFHVLGSTTIDHSVPVEKGHLELNL